MVSNKVSNLIESQRNAKTVFEKEDIDDQIGSLLMEEKMENIEN